jgi:hypothetical protein
MILKILAVAGIGVVGLLGYAYFKSPEMHVSRELLISATPEMIFNHANNSKKFFQWATWMDNDPSVEMNYSGPSEGLGSFVSWKSKGMMGEGTAEVVESVANRSVKRKLTYIKPMEMSQLSEISLSPSNGATLVRLSMSWNNPFVIRLMCIFANMEKKMGATLEKDLLKLKQLVENAH